MVDGVSFCLADVSGYLCDFFLSKSGRGIIKIFSEKADSGLSLLTILFFGVSKMFWQVGACMFGYWFSLDGSTGSDSDFIC